MSGTDQPSRDHVVHRGAHDSEGARYGGVKFGVAFFGWLTATGMLVLLTALVTAAGAALGVATGTDLEQAANQASENPETIGVVGAIALGVILLIAYYCGGYVAGRMARFDGAKQGFAVWLWAVLIAVAVGILGALAGSKYDIFSQLNNFPRIPVDPGQLSTVGVVALVGAVVLALIAAVLGGAAGMRFHRRVDDADLAAHERRREPDVTA
jgi:amino acid transporter